VELGRLAEGAVGRAVLVLRRASICSSRGSISGAGHLTSIQPGHPVGLVLSREMSMSGPPAVALRVDADEHLRLREIGAIQRAGRVATHAELEHDRRQPELLDGASSSWRSYASSPSVDEIKTRSRRSGVWICAAGAVLDESSVAIRGIVREPHQTERLRSPRRSRFDPDSLAESPIGDLGLRPSGPGR
jgi:hypothetical protein